MIRGSGIQLPTHNITTVGAFNPAILRPDWVVRRVLSAAPAGVESLLPIGGGPILHRAGRLLWFAQRDRLVVLSDDSNETAQFVAEVLTVLPQTPLQAAGVNFQLTHAGGFGLLGEKADSLGVLQGELAERSTSRVVLRPDGVRVTVTETASSVGGEHVLSFNYHLDATGLDEVERAEQLKGHVRRAPEFETDALRMKGTTQ